jgi:dUTP pyrophosphatase
MANITVYIVIYIIVYIKAKDRLLISTGLMIALPNQTYGRIAARSGLCIRSHNDIGGNKIHVFNLIKTFIFKGGAIDEDYRGIIKVIMINNGIKDFTIEKGMKIAQLIIEKIVYPECIVVNTLNETSRGKKGFGPVIINK